MITLISFIITIPFLALVIAASVSSSVGYESEQQLEHNYELRIVIWPIRAERFSSRCQCGTFKIDLDAMCNTASICHCKQIRGSRWIRQYDLMDSRRVTGQYPLLRWGHAGPRNQCLPLTLDSMALYHDSDHRKVKMRRLCLLHHDVIL